MTYFCGLQIDEGTQIPIGSSLYGTCDSLEDATTKVVTMSSFDSFYTGITIHVKFTYANTVTTGLKLQVGNSTEAYVFNPGGTLTWSAGAMISFTYDGAGWVMNDGKGTEVTVSNIYDDSSTDPISGVGIADAISTLENNMISGFGADKTLLTLSQTDGIITATFQPISITMSSITDIADILEDTELTGTPIAPTAAVGTSTDQIATTQFVMNAVQNLGSAVDALIFKGTLGTGGTVAQLPTEYKTGWTYRVITVGTYAGQTCEYGDLIIAIHDSLSGQSSTINNHWTIAQANIDGMVIGPPAAVDQHVVVFNGASGKSIADSGYTIAANVPANAKFTDTEYVSTGTIAAYTGHEITSTTGATILASIQSGTLHLSGGIRFITNDASTGIRVRNQ